LVALEASGHLVEPDPEPIEFPGNVEAFGGITGDIRTTDSGGIRHAYFVRVDGTRAIPGWLVTFARASHDIEDLKVLVIVDEPSSVLEASCRSAGAGLLALRETGEYMLDVVVSPDEYDRDRISREFTERVTGLRRQLENRQDLELEAARGRYRDTQDAVEGMPLDRAEEYLARVEGEPEAVRQWAETISGRLDEAMASGDAAGLDVVATLIHRGPG